MPGGDRTGPAGLGPMTGGAAGYCAGYSVFGAVNSAFGRGNRPDYGPYLGFGFRRGRRGRWAAPYIKYGYGKPYIPIYGTAPTRQQELDLLVDQAEYLKDALEDIKQRIEELEAKKTEE